MSYGDHQPCFPWKPIVIGIVIGYLISLNYHLHNIDYRISFYGYHKVDGKVYPVIKLRKKMKGSPLRIGISDPGQDLEIGEMRFSELGQNLEFSDDDVLMKIKEKYCG